MIEIIKDRNYDGQQDLGSVAQELHVLTLFDQAINPLLEHWSIFSRNRNCVIPTWSSRIRKPVRKTVINEINITGAVTKYLEYAGYRYIFLAESLEIKPEYISLPVRVRWLRLPGDFTDLLLALVLDPGLRQQLPLGVHGAPHVGQLRRPSLPGLQVDRGPDDVEEGEHDEANVFNELSLAAEKYL